MSHLYIFGPLAGVLLGVVLSFIRLPKLAWLPVTVAVVLAISLVGAMWKALRRGRRTGEKAMFCLALPGLNVLAPFFWIARWPQAVNEALPEREEEGPSTWLFTSSAVLFAAASAALLAYAASGTEVLGVVAGAVGMLFFVFWLAASREAVSFIEELDDELGGDGPDPEAAEWAREREAVRAAFVTGGGADRAWATDLIVRHARRGDPEASLWATAMMSDDPRALPAVLSGQPIPAPLEPDG